MTSLASLMTSSRRRRCAICARRPAAPGSRDRGTRVTCYDDLVDKEYYVAVGRGKFRDIGYVNTVSPLQLSHIYNLGTEIGAGALALVYAKVGEKCPQI